MLNYLVVMPRLVQEIGDGYNFPLGIAYVSAALKRAGFNVFCLNPNHHSGDIVDIVRREIEAHDINVVMSGGLSFQYYAVLSILRAAKETSKSIITIAGGGLVTADPLATMQALKCADVGVIGEGEITIIELCHALERGDNLSDILGIIYLTGEGFKTTAPRQYIKDLDSLAWPDYEGFELGEYFKTTPSFAGMNQNNTIFALTSRSCPYLCTFCFHTTGRKYRMRSLDDFFAELDCLVARYPIKQMSISDELFSDNIERVKEFCRRIKPYGIGWWAQFRVDNITSELIAILKDGNCANMTFGLESADNRILKSMRKNTTIEMIERATKMAYDAGMSVTGAFIFGDIAETWETANNTINWCRAHPEYNIAMSMISVFPGSYLYKYACEKGIIKDKVQYLKNQCPQINVSQLTNKEFGEIVRLTLESQIVQGNLLESIETSNFDYKRGRIDVAGVCTGCGRHNAWANVKLFRAFNFLTCRHCGKKYNMILPDDLRANIENNLTKLLDKYDKLAVWGINYVCVDLFQKSAALGSKHVYPVDISDSAQKSDVLGRRIYSPSVIGEQGIKAVVVALPHYFTLIKERIEGNYPGVAVYDICGLMQSIVTLI